MSGLFLTRLLIAGDRPSRRRLLGIVAGVMVAVALLLMLLSAAQAFPARSLRSTWVSLPEHSLQDLAPDQQLAPDELAAASLNDIAQGRLVSVLLVAQPPGGTSVRIPGSDVVPSPGQYLASPALARLVAATPADQLGERYGQMVGTLDPLAVEGPDSLVAVVGTDLGTVAGADSMLPPKVVTELRGTPFSADAYRVVTIIGAIAVLIPALLLVGIVTDLGSAQRAERFAALRLIGATPQQVARTAAIETGATTLLGALAGVGLYLAAIPLAAQLTLGSSRLYPGDLLTSPLTMGAVVALTTAGATAVSWWRTRRADIGPLGGSRERQERRPHALAVLPLALAVAGLMITPLVRERAPVAVSLALIGLFILTMLGILWAGPVLTWWAARLGGTTARSAAQVIAYGRLSRHPRSVFRAVAGIVVAVYAVTVFAVMITVASGREEALAGHGRLSPSALHVMPRTAEAGALERAEEELSSVPGVTSTALGWVSTGEIRNGSIVLDAQDAAALGAGSVEAPSGMVRMSTEWLFSNTPAPPSALDRAPGPEELGASAPILLVGTDPGDPAALERARTALTTAGLGLGRCPLARADIAVYQGAAMENQFASMAYLGILIATGISAVSLGVSTIAALLSRRRVLGLLRLTGMPAATLRSMISYETVLPTALVALLSLGLGTLSAWSMVTGLSSRAIDWPARGYYLTLAVCALMVGLAVVAAARAARRMVEGSTVRFE